MLKVVSLHITNRCNSKCRHCFVNGGQDTYDEMTTNHIKKFISEFAVESNNAGRINVFGGEPLLRDDIFEIIENTHEHGLQIELATGGTIPQERIDKLIEARPDFMSFDLDGGKAESHDWLRNCEGHFEKMQGIITKFIAAGIYTNVIMVVNNNNKDEIKEFLDKCVELKVNEATLQFFNAMGRGRELADLVVGSEDWMMTREVAHQWYAHNKPKFTMAWQKAYMNNDSDFQEEVWDCKTKSNERIFLRTNGEIYRCALLYGSDQCAGNIKEDSLRIILDKFDQISNEEIKGCPAISYHMLGNPKVQDPRNETCEYTPTCPREREYKYYNPEY